jgi:signal transduction histidine kinase
VRRLRNAVGTVRFRVTALATVVVAVVLVAAGIVLTTVQRTQLTSNLEQAIEDDADAVEDAIEDGDLRSTLPIGDDDELIQVVGPDGEVLAANDDAIGAPPFADPPSADDDDTWRTVDDLPVSDSDEEYRLLSRRVETADGVVVVHVADELEDIGESTGILAVSLAIAIPIVVAILAALVWWLVGRSLRPVDAIRSEVDGIGGRELDRRVPEPPGNDEIARLARTMNAMLGRLEDAQRREQRFVADASHELRTPLTRMRSELEVDLAQPATADLAATHRSVLDETIALQHLVDDLLQLARSDAGAQPRRDGDVDLDDIVLREAGRMRAEGVTVDTASVTAAQIRGDHAQLARAIRNLADNAGRHARTGVAFGLAEHDHSAVLTVTDDGPGIPVEEQRRVFERFTRLDEARSTADGGTGLGLAISRDIVERHGGRIAIDPSYAAGTRIVVVLPATPTI